MSTLQSMLFSVVSFLASIAGAICGIGGGVIIKPALDLLGWASVSTISFLSGCTVLSAIDLRDFFLNCPIGIESTVFNCCSTTS